MSAVAHGAGEFLRAADDPYLGDYFRNHHERLALDYEWLTREVRRDARVLEVGGFPFFLSAALAEAGLRLEVVDKSRAPASHLIEQRGGRVVACDIETEPLPYPAGEFDEILFNEVFEHLRIDPVFTLREVLRVLRPGGRLWLSTPNLASLRGIANLLFRDEAWSVVGEGVYEQYAHLATRGWMGHVREYTATEVVGFLQRVGFEVVGVVYRGSYRTALARVASALYPRLRPSFSCIATKR